MTEPIALAARSCERCLCRHTEGKDHFCRRNPPTAFLIQQPARFQGQPPQMIPISLCPPVQLDHYCVDGFRPRMMDA